MKEIVSLINNIELSKDISAEKLSEEILNSTEAYVNGTYDWKGYTGHHSLLISNNLKEVLSGNINNTERTYLGLMPYTQNLNDESNSFELDYLAVREALKVEIEAENRIGNSPAYVGTFKDTALSSLSNLTKIDSLTPGQFFYLYNSLKNTREEFIDDFI